jgi:hypothetical protein
MSAFVFSFVILGSRQGTTFLPRRDYSHFIGSLSTWRGPGKAVEPLPAVEARSEAIIPKR